MNLQQLEYIIAVDNYRHFAKAAESSFVTQPTLSMMIQKLEDELDVKIFDRSQVPVQPTVIGVEIINQARIIIGQVKQIKEIIQEEKGLVKGVFKLGVIPTIAPYLLPKLMKIHTKGKHEILLSIEEMSTNQIVSKLISGHIDGGILATPLNNDKLKEHPLYYERFFAYISPQETELQRKEEITENDIDESMIWLLEEVHCLRGQILQICKNKKRKGMHNLLAYEAGSINTLVNIIDSNRGLTIIPEMAIETLSSEQKKNVRTISDMTPVREVSLVTKKDFLREKILNILTTEIKDIIPNLNEELKQFVLSVN